MADKNVKISAGNMLTEFETGTATGLAPFEDAGSILLDDFSSSSPSMLREFDDLNDSDEIIIIKTHGTDPGNGAGDDIHDEEVPPEVSGQSGEQSEEVPVNGTGESERLIRDDEETVPEYPIAPAPVGPVIGFVCEHALNLKRSVDRNGRLLRYPDAHVIPLPCAGMMKPEWVKFALDTGASGVFVLSCSPSTCHHRSGSCITARRLNGWKTPSLDPNIDRSRFGFFSFPPAESRQALDEIGAFIKTLTRPEPASEKRDVQPDIKDFTF